MDRLRCGSVKLSIFGENLWREILKGTIHPLRNALVGLLVLGEVLDIDPSVLVLDLALELPERIFELLLFNPGFEEQGSERKLIHPADVRVLVRQKKEKEIALQRIEVHDEVVGPELRIDVALLGHSFMS